MIAYIIQVLLFQVLFLAVYDFFLSKETFHDYNRWYLLGTPMMSFMLPLIKIPTFQKAVPEDLMMYLPEILLSPQKVIEQTTYYSESSVNYINLVFLCGVVLFTLVFLVKLYKIFRLISVNETIKKSFYKLVLLPKQTTAFSFFNFIFLGKNISKERQEDIIQHELIHSKQKHSLDLLFFEFLRIVMWFNPMIYLYQQRITLLHEYISDAEVVKTTKKHDYFNKLLSQTFQVENISFVNQFYKHSFMKKRITMMTKNKSKQIKKAKYLLLLPLLTSMLFYTSCDRSQIEEIQPEAKKELQIRFTEFQGEVKEYIGKKETYTDIYIGAGLPEGNAISYQNLSENEKEEYDKSKSILKINEKYGEVIDLKLYRKNNGRVTIANIFDFSKMKPILSNKTNDDKSVPISLVDRLPVFLIDEVGLNGKNSKKYTNSFQKNIKNYVTTKFDVSLSKNLGLSKGRKKIWTVFKVDEKGNVIDVNARAPHPKLKEEVERIVKSLPKMEPAMKDGKAVSMKYTLPISFTVE